MNPTPPPEAVNLAGQRHVLHLYRQAATPGSPLKGLLKHCDALAAALNESAPVLEKLSRPKLAARVEAGLADCPPPLAFEARLKSFAQDFGLNPAETAVLGFAAVCDV